MQQMPACTRRRCWRRAVRLAAVGVCAWPTLGLATPPVEPQQVTVTARQPDLEEHSYRDMVKAMAMFEPYHQAHPDAVLRFRIRQRKEMPGVDMANLVVYVRDPVERTHLPVQVDPDGSFTLPVVPELREHDAVVRTNMPPGSLAWNVRITRAGADTRDRVLGDIREECRLDVHAADLMRVIKNPWYFAFKSTMTDMCRNPLINWNSYGEKPVFAVHLRSGERSKSLSEAESLHDGIGVPLFYPLQDWPYLLLDYTYWPPVGDSGWPDDTTIHLTYTDDLPESLGGQP